MVRLTIHLISGSNISAAIISEYPHIQSRPLDFFPLIFFKILLISSSETSRREKPCCGMVFEDKKTLSSFNALSSLVKSYIFALIILILLMKKVFTAFAIFRGLDTILPSTKICAGKALLVVPII